MRLELQPVVTDVDLLALKTEAVTARIQEVQRTEQMASFTAAAMAVFRRAFPDETVPGSAEAIVEQLRDREHLLASAAQDLAARRLTAVRQRLVEAAGIARDRLLAAAPPPAGMSGDGRVEFELRPAS